MRGRCAIRFLYSRGADFDGLLPSQQKGWEGEGGESIAALVEWAEETAGKAAENEAVKAASTKGSRTA